MIGTREWDLSLSGRSDTLLPRDGGERVSPATEPNRWMFRLYKATASGFDPPGRVHGLADATVLRFLRRC